MCLSACCQCEWAQSTESWAYEVGHHGASIHESSSGVRPLQMIDLAAIAFDQCSVKNPVVMINKTNRACPVIAFGSPVGVGLVSRVPSQPGGKLEECPSRYSVLVVVSLVEVENLPAQAPATGRCIPAGYLVVECVDSEIEPGGGAGGGGGGVGEL